MSWFIPWPEFVKQRLCRYLLQHYLGHYFQEKITLKQLSIDFFNGTVSLKNINLDCESLNEQFTAFDLPFEIKSGTIGDIYIYIPWHNLLNDSCKLEIKNISITMRPKKSASASDFDMSSSASMLSSVFLNSMQTSMQIAKECLLNDDDETNEDIGFDDAKNTSANISNLIGLDAFAQTIDSILARIKVTAESINIRIEHITDAHENNYSNGIALEFHLKSIKYFDFDLKDPSQFTSKNDQKPQQQQQAPQAPQQAQNQRAAIQIKNFTIEGLTVYCDEFVINETTRDTETPTPHNANDLTQSIYVHRTKATLTKYVYTNPFLCATFSGIQEIQLRIKTPSIIGETKPQASNTPKLELSAQFGSIKCLLCPKQLHLLTAMFDAIINSKTLYDPSKDSNQTLLKQKPIRGYDQAKFETLLQYDLSQMTHDMASFSEPNHYSTSHLFDDSEFKSIIDTSENREKEQAESRRSTFNLSSNKNSAKNLADEVQKVLADPTLDLFTFSVKFTLFSLTILLEDPLSGSGDESENLSSNRMLGSFMKSVAEEYFDHVATLNTCRTSSNGSELSEIRRRFFEACAGCNHLLLVSKPITIKIVKKLKESQFQVSDCALSIGSLELLEYLSPKQPKSAKKSQMVSSATITHLIQFNSNNSSSSQSDATSSLFDSLVKIKLLLYEPLMSKSAISGSYPLQQLTQVHATLNHITVDIDISIIDRLVHLMPRQSSHNSSAPITPTNSAGELFNEDPQGTSAIFTLDIKCPNASAVLRFPIADLRPPHERRSRFTREIRDQSLIISFNDLALKMTSYSSDPTRSFTISSQQLNLFYKYKESDLVPFCIGVLSHDKDSGELIELNFKIQPNEQKNFDLLIDSDSDERLRNCSSKRRQSSGFEIHVDSVSFDNTDYGPFSSSCSVISSEKNRRMIEPASKRDMNAFIRKCGDDAELTIDVNIPNIRLLLPDKYFLNDVYNRFVNDLLMWEPSALEGELLQHAPRISVISRAKDKMLNTQQSMTQSMYFSMDEAASTATRKSFDTCVPQMFKSLKELKESVIYECNEDYDDDDDDEEFAEDSNDAKKETENENLKDTNSQHKVCFVLNIKNAHIKSFYQENSSENSKNLNYAEFDICAGNLKLCTISGYRGDLTNQYICLYSDRVQLSHSNKHLDSMKAKKNTFYQWEPEALLQQFNDTKFNFILTWNKLATPLFRSDDATGTSPFNPSAKNTEIQTPMLSAAIEVNIRPPSANKTTTPTIKDIVIAFNINDVSLSHLFCPESEFWLTQFLDLLKFDDIEICGYVVPLVLTELHLNVTNSCIDYRPANIDLKSLISFKSLRISSNVTQSSDATLLVFNLEDIYLFLSNKSERIIGRELDLRADYVCIANADVFELRLLINDQQQQEKGKKSQSVNTQMDIKLRCNLIQVRTCVDSCYALIQLINYIVSDGDLIVSPGEASMGLESTPQKASNDAGLIEPLPSPSVTIATSGGNISSMVNDAMTQSVYNPPVTYLNQTLKRKSRTRLLSAASEISDNDFESAANDSVADIGSYIDEEIANDEQQHAQADNNNRRESTNGDYSYSHLFQASNNNNNNDAADESDEDEFLDEFDFVDLIPGLGETPKNGEFEVKYLQKNTSNGSGGIEIDANHFSKPLAKIDVLKPPDNYPIPEFSYSIQEISLNWCLYGGSDFGDARESNLYDDASLSVSPGKSELSCAFSRDVSETLSSYSPTKVHFDETASIKSAGKRSIAINLQPSYAKCLPKKAGGRLSNKYANKSNSWIVNGPASRNHSQCIELACHKVKTKIDMYETASASHNYLYRVALALGDIEIRDRLSSSAFNMFLFRYESDTCPKHTNANIVFLKVLFSKSNDEQRLLECDIKLSIQPLRFNIDQDALLFLVDFFQSLLHKDAMSGNSASNSSFSASGGGGGSINASPSSNNLAADKSATEPQQKIFIKNFIFSPDLLIRFDFSGKYDKRPNRKLDAITNLLMVMVQLSNTEVVLKKVCYKRGFLGAEKLMQCLLKEWIGDIQKNQVKNLIKGWGIFNSLIQFFEGFTYLFWYPIEQYKKDGRVLFGIKKGSTAFSTCTILATIELTSRMFQMTKNIAEFFYDLVTPSHKLSIDGENSIVIKNRNIRVRRHPNDIREGLTNAYYVIFEGINDTAANLVNEINVGCESTGIRGGIGGALRHLPSAAVMPLMLTSEATCNILNGIRNQLKPDEKRDDDQKWKSVAN